MVLLHDQTEESDGDRARQREGWPAPAQGRAPRPRHLNEVVVERRQPSDARDGHGARPSGREDEAQKSVAGR